MDVLSLCPSFPTFPPSQLPCRAGSKVLRPAHRQLLRDRLFWPGPACRACLTGAGEGDGSFFSPFLQLRPRKPARPFSGQWRSGGTGCRRRPVFGHRRRAAALLEALPGCNLPGCRCICCLQLAQISPAFPLSQALASAALLRHCQQRALPPVWDALVCRRVAG